MHYFSYSQIFMQYFFYEKVSYNIFFISFFLYVHKWPTNYGLLPMSSGTLIWLHTRVFRSFDWWSSGRTNIVKAKIYEQKEKKIMREAKCAKLITWKEKERNMVYAYLFLVRFITLLNCFDTNKNDIYEYIKFMHFFIYQVYIKYFWTKKKIKTIYLPLHTCI